MKKLDHYLEEAIADLKELIQRILDNEHLGSKQKLRVISEIVKIDPIKTAKTGLPFQDKNNEKRRQYINCWWIPKQKEEQIAFSLCGIPSTHAF